MRSLSTLIEKYALFVKQTRIILMWLPELVTRWELVGQGYARLDKFSSLTNFHRPMTANNNDKIVRKVLCASKSFAIVICKMLVATCTKMPKQKILS